MLTLLEKEYATTSSEARRQRLETFRGEVVCPECKGARLRPEARAVRFAGRAIHEATAMTVEAARRFFASFSPTPQQEPIARPILREIMARLDFLDNVGLEYLTLDRAAGTLSGGELQRVRLATGLGSGLVGVCYVLDEPSIGLHPARQSPPDRTPCATCNREATRWSSSNTTKRSCARPTGWWTLGRRPGGTAAASSPRARPPKWPRPIARSPAAILSGRQRIPVPAAAPRRQDRESITIEGVTTNNLKDVTVQFPLSALVCVTGRERIGQEFAGERDAWPGRWCGGWAASRPSPARHAASAAPTRSTRWCRSTSRPSAARRGAIRPRITGVFDEIRKVFASTRDARQRGYKAGRFSFNVKGGRCEECQGQGQRRIEMNFLPDLYVACPVCEGKRFNRQTLEIRYRDRSIADVLDMRVDEAAEFFENFPAIARLLGSLQEVGLGYVTLGQSSTTLSGGEAQRIKLATELSRVDTGKTLYILDEPTTGLHFDDIRKLLAVLGRLVDLGNTVLVIEHNLDVIKTADWIIDLGPDGGQDGGRVVAAGTPEQVAAMEDNCTGQYLRAALNGAK